MNADEITAVLNSILSELGITAPYPQGKGPHHENPDAPRQGQSGQRTGQSGADRENAELTSGGTSSLQNNESTSRRVDVQDMRAIMHFVANNGVCSFSFSACRGKE